jgi:hypothetical protein
MILYGDNKQGTREIRMAHLIKNLKPIWFMKYGIKKGKREIHVWQQSSRRNFMENGVTAL